MALDHPSFPNTVLGLVNDANALGAIIEHTLHTLNVPVVVENASQMILTVANATAGANNLITQVNSCKT